jgi:hypothetical protein
MRDLFEGGERMRKNVARHIPRHDVEPHDVYRRRCQAAHYLNYCGAIGGYFASFLFSSPLKVEGGDEAFWGEFKEDADGLGSDLVDFSRAALLSSLVDKTAFWRVEFPSPTAPVVTKADYEAQRLNRARLVALARESVIDWERDDRGAYLWIRDHQHTDRREETGAPCMETDTWTEWRADGSARRWSVTYEEGREPGDDVEIGEVDPPFNPTGQIPIVELSLPTDLWLMGHLSQPATEHFRKRNALSWAIDRTCYAMPAFFLEDRKNPPAMGSGYYLMLGTEERVEWPAPPAQPFATIGEYLSALKDELYRVAQVMARGVDNSAAAVGRSGESKQADDRATEIVVGAYAARVRESLQQTAALIAKGSGTEAPVIAGLDNYAVIDAASTVETALSAATLDIPSITFKRKALERVAAAMLPDLDEATRRDIANEIKTGTDAESMAPPPPPVVKPPVKGAVQ